MEIFGYLVVEWPSRYDSSLEVGGQLWSVIKHNAKIAAYNLGKTMRLWRGKNYLHTIPHNSFIRPLNYHQTYL